MVMCFLKVLNIVQNRDDKQVSFCTPGPVDCKKLPRVCLQKVSEDVMRPRGKDQLIKSAMDAGRGVIGMCLPNLHRWKPH